MCQGPQFLSQLYFRVLVLLADLLEGASTFIVSEDRAIAEHNMTRSELRIQSQPETVATCMLVAFWEI